MASISVAFWEDNAVNFPEISRNTLQEQPHIILIKNVKVSAFNGKSLSGTFHSVT
jgi:hypothetical protein